MTERIEKTVAESVSGVPERVPLYLRAGDQSSLFLLSVFVIAGMVGATGWFAFRVNGLQYVDSLKSHEVTLQVDINQADWTEISALPNIGETMARRIVRYREQNGPFHSYQSILNVEGIGILTLESMRPFLGSLEQLPPGLTERVAEYDRNSTGKIGKR